MDLDDSYHVGDGVCISTRQGTRGYLIAVRLSADRAGHVNVCAVRQPGKFSPKAKFRMSSDVHIGTGIPTGDLDA